MTKAKYKCLCGHAEAVHCFDPHSIMFGCVYGVITYSHDSDGTPNGEPSEIGCSCREFKPDTLRYLEDAYVECTAKRS